MPTKKKKSWHSSSEEELFLRFKTDHSRGLTKNEAEVRLLHFGENRLTGEERTSVLSIIGHQFKSPLIIILVIAGAISIFLNEQADAIVIGITIAINTFVGALQEGKASKAFLKLQQHLTKHAVVIREGREQQIDSTLVVPGDIIILRAGDFVPADARVLEARNLRINEAALTGEWVEVDKKAGVLSARTRITEQDNMVFAGTLVEDGRAHALVVATGNTTEFGKISILVGVTRKTRTPLQKNLSTLAKGISIVTLCVVVAIVVLGVVRGESINEMFILAVAVAVAVVPEGLPIAVTVILALGMERILQKGGLVKKLTAAETLGSTSVILTDKTGTLTEGEMQVAEVITADSFFGPPREAEIEKSGAHMVALKIGTATSDAFIENPEADLAEWHVRGNATDRALLLAGIQAGIKPAELLASEPRLDFLPFESERRFAASLNTPNGKQVLYVSGAPEVVVATSTHLFINGQAIPIADNQVKELIKKHEEITAHGMRVIAVGYKEVPDVTSISSSDKTLFDGLTYVGFIGFHDPLRADAKDSIAKAHAAGLRTVIMTGDHKLTARKIAEEIGIDLEKHIVMEGEHLEGMSDEELRQKVGLVGVYARVLPHQKLRIVQAWQERGAVVAMTGDGINEAPALKRADVGIALGSGTEVAKEASDIVLLDNSFGVLVAAIAQGRVIFDNLQKVITYIFATGFTELILIGGAFLTGFPIPVHATQILWTNIVGEGLLNLAFAFEPGEDDVMKRKPEKRARIFTREMLLLIFIIGIATDLVLFSLFYFLHKTGHELELIRTMMFAGLAIGSLFFAYSLRSLRRGLWQISPLSNKFFLLSMFVSILLLVGAFLIAPIQRLLLIVPLGWNELKILIGLAFLNIVFIEIGKWFFVARSIQEKK